MIPFSPYDLPSYEAATEGLRGVVESVSPRTPCYRRSTNTGNVTRPNVSMENVARLPNLGYTFAGDGHTAGSGNVLTMIERDNQSLFSDPPKRCDRDQMCDYGLEDRGSDTVHFPSNTGQACVTTKENMRLAVIAVAEEMGLSRTEGSINMLTSNMEVYCRDTLTRLNLVCGQVLQQTIIMQQVQKRQEELAAQVSDLNRLLERRDSYSQSSDNDRRGFQNERQTPHIYPIAADDNSEASFPDLNMNDSVDDSFMNEHAASKTAGSKRRQGVMSKVLPNRALSGGYSARSARNVKKQTTEKNTKKALSRKRSLPQMRGHQHSTIPSTWTSKRIERKRCTLEHADMLTSHRILYDAVVGYSYVTGSNRSSRMTQRYVPT